MDINRITLIGRLTHKPEAKELPSGQTCARFGLATNYMRDTTADGQRVLMLRASGADGVIGAPAHIRVVLNWFVDLRARIPTGR